jgi:hypothetical protein
MTIYLLTYISTYIPICLFNWVLIYLFMKRIEVQMLLYTLKKYFIGVQRNILNPFDIYIVLQNGVVV